TNPPITPSTYQYTWSIDGKGQPGSSNQLSVTPGALKQGTHKVDLLVQDKTSFVRNDPTKLLQEKQSWSINVTRDCPVGSGGTGGGGTGGVGSGGIGSGGIGNGGFTSGGSSGSAGAPYFAGNGGTASGVSGFGGSANIAGTGGVTAGLGGGGNGQGGSPQVTP